MVDNPGNAEKCNEYAKKQALKFLRKNIGPYKVKQRESNETEKPHYGNVRLCIFKNILSLLPDFFLNFIKPHHLFA